MPAKLAEQSKSRKAEYCDPAMYGAITFDSVSCYEIFERVGFAAAKLAADAAGEASLRCPLWQRDAKGKFPEFVIPGFGRRSSIYVIAIQAAFLVWTQVKAGNPLPESVFLKAALEGHKLWKLGVK